MSRGFVKESDFEEPLVVPARAPLPAGQPNHTTPRGLRLLHEEELRYTTQLAALSDKRAAGDAAAKRETDALQARLVALRERIASASVVAPANRDAAPGEIRFGVTARLRVNGKERTYTLVGVDEAKAREGRISVHSPLATGLLGHRVGDVFDVEVPAGALHIEVRALTQEE